jgi:hemerythrin-like metal-binding protein
MEPLVFTDSLKFGVAVIDRQHRRMVKIVNELLRAVLDHPLGESEHQLLDEFVRLADLNFRAEEVWMQRCCYEHRETHSESHTHLLHELVVLRDEMLQRHDNLNRKAVIFVRRWLENHLIHADRELADAIRHYLPVEPIAKRRRGLHPRRNMLNASDTEKAR